MTDRVADHQDNQRGQLDERRWARELNRSIKRTATEASTFRFGASDTRDSLVFALVDVGVFYVYKDVLIDFLLKPQNTVEHLLSGGLTVVVLNAVTHGVAIMRKQEIGYDLRPNHAALTLSSLTESPMLQLESVHLAASYATQNSVFSIK